MIKTLIFLSLCGFAFCDLRCYDCDPSEAHGCVDPQSNNVKSTTCGSPESRQGRRVFRVKEASGNDEYECFSAYFKSPTEDQTGIYRGCRPKGTEECIFDLEDNVAGNFTKCKFCAENECNVHSINGSGSVTVSVILVMLSAIMGFYVAEF